MRRYVTFDEQKGVVIRYERKPRKATCIAEKHLDNEANIGVVWCKRRRRLFRYCKECKRAANRESMRRRRSAA